MFNLRYYGRTQESIKATNEKDMAHFHGIEHDRYIFTFAQYEQPVYRKYI